MSISLFVLKCAPIYVYPKYKAKLLFHIGEYFLSRLTTQHIGQWNLIFLPKKWFASKKYMILFVPKEIKLKMMTLEKLCRFRNESFNFYALNRFLIRFAAI